MRYEERDGGVFDTETSTTLRRGGPGWKEYEAWLNAALQAAPPPVGGSAVPPPAVAPHARVRPLGAIGKRRAEARARVRGSMADVLLRSRAKVAVDGAVLWADMPHILFYLLLAQRASVPAGLSIPDVNGQPFQLTDVRLRTLLTRIGVRYLNYFTAAADRIAAVNASATPETLDTTIDALEDGEAAPAPAPPLPPANP